jgi:Mrr N-terminal domain
MLAHPSPQKVRQQKRILLLALYLYKKKFGFESRNRQQVRRFILHHHLMHIPADDSDLRSTGEELWENDLAWRRADLKAEGFIDMPKHGQWRLTELGEKEVEAWALRVKERYDCDPNFGTQFKFDPKHSDIEWYVTPQAFEWVRKIANAERR